MAGKSALIVVVLVVVGCMGANPTADGSRVVRPTGQNGFIYIGERSLVRGGKAGLERYYVSVNPAGWSNAKKDCEKHWPNGEGRLLIVEDEEEKFYLGVLLEDFGSGNLYWTGGQYAASLGWYWASTRPVEVVPEFATPPTDRPLSSQDRIILNHENSVDMTFEILQDSQPQRYICEVKDSPCRQC